LPPGKSGWGNTVSAKEIQNILDREKPWFDLGRMSLTAVGFALASALGAKYVFAVGRSAFDVTIHMLPLVGPIIFSIFLFYRIIVVVNSIVDIYFPQVRFGNQSIFMKFLGFVTLFFVLYSTNGIISLFAAALNRP
jgi:hypothetical protein